MLLVGIEVRNFHCMSAEKKINTNHNEKEERTTSTYVLSFCPVNNIEGCWQCVIVDFYDDLNWEKTCSVGVCASINRIVK